MQAMIAVMLCTYMDFSIKNVGKWFFSTFIHGFASLFLLFDILWDYEVAADPKTAKKIEMPGAFGIDMMK